MSELDQLLTADGAYTPPPRILDGLTDELVHRKPAGAPHSIYEELWHINFWLQISLDWISGIETSYPPSPLDGFPTVQDVEKESWTQLCQRFLSSVRRAGDAANDESRLNTPVRCPSRPGDPVRTMTVREQLENLACHNGYHFGRIVLLRQLFGSWPPPSGGFTW